MCDRHFLSERTIAAAARILKMDLPRIFSFLFIYFFLKEITAFQGRFPGWINTAVKQVHAVKANLLKDKTATDTYLTKIIPIPLGKYNLFS